MLLQQSIFKEMLKFTGNFSWILYRCGKIHAVLCYRTESLGIKLFSRIFTSPANTTRNWAIKNKSILLARCATFIPGSWQLRTCKCAFTYFIFKQHHCQLANLPWHSVISFVHLPTSLPQQSWQFVNCFCFVFIFYSFNHQEAAFRKPSALIHCQHSIRF